MGVRVESRDTVVFVHARLNRRLLGDWGTRDHVRDAQPVKSEGDRHTREHIL